MVQRILAASPPNVRPAFTLLAETGTRVGELAWLTRGDVGPTALRVRPKDRWRPKAEDQRAIPRTPAVDRVLEPLPRAGRWVVTMPPSACHPRPGRQWTERRLLATRSGY